MYTYIDSVRQRIWETDMDLIWTGIECFLGYGVVDLNAGSSHICHTLSTN